MTQNWKKLGAMGVSRCLCRLIDDCKLSELWVHAEATRQDPIGVALGSNIKAVRVFWIIFCGGSGRTLNMNKWGCAVPRVQ